MNGLLIIDRIPTRTIRLDIECLSEGRADLEGRLREMRHGGLFKKLIIQPMHNFDIKAPEETISNSQI
jgi:hypothetical protein